MASKENTPKVVLPSAPMLQLLKGQKALVTGSSSGIGAAVALSLGEAGADVIVNYRSDKSAESAEDICQKIRKFGVKSFAFQADVSKEADVLALYEKSLKEFGTIDILISNAGIQRDSPFDEMTLEQWNQVIQTNLTGQFLCCREAVKIFKKRGVVPGVSCAAGKIICMSSVHQLIPWAGHVNYATSKGGINMMMSSIAQEVAPHRIRVNSIAPGAIKTHINESAWDTPAAVEDLLRLIPYKRIGDPSDIGKCAAWLASDHADYITGSTIYVDGGMTLFPGFATGG
jgi:glucose 1-dehydrogenase